MITGTSGRALRARGKSSIPLMPGMLTSERMRMRRALLRADAFQRLRRAPLHVEARGAQLLAELLAEEFGDVRFVVDDHQHRRS